MGRCLNYEGRYDRAEPDLRRAIAIYAGHNFHIPQVGIRGDLAAAAVAQGDLPAAERLLSEAVTHAIAHHIPWTRCDPVAPLEDLAAVRESKRDEATAAALRHAAATFRQTFGIPVPPAVPAQVAGDSGGAR
jgi:hypothetical protein